MNRMLKVILLTMFFIFMGALLKSIANNWTQIQYYAVCSVLIPSCLYIMNKEMKEGKE